jgi:glycogen operon protein
MLIAFRRVHPAFLRPEFFTGSDSNFNAIPDITWYDEIGNGMNWSRRRNIIAFRIDGSRAEIMADRDDNDFYVMLNGSRGAVSFTVCQPPAGRSWFRVIDTASESPDDFREAGDEEPLGDQLRYPTEPRSAVVLLAK